MHIPFLDIAIQIIHWLQNLGPWLTPAMQAFSFLGSEPFYLFTVPAIYWCWDAALGLRFGASLMLSSILNATLKLAFHNPRPYWVHTDIQALATESSFGIPSGHAQNAVVVWGVLAAWFRRRSAWLVAVMLAFLIGLSRLALGVQYPLDVVVGWLVGAAVLAVLLKVETPLRAWFRNRSIQDQALWVVGVSLALLVVGTVLRLWLETWHLPQEWVVAASLAAPKSELIHPLALADLISYGGSFFGLAFGAVMLRAVGGFKTQGSARKRLLRYPLGIAGVAALWFGLGVIFPRGEFLLAYALRYLRYGLVGFWITFIAPFIFVKLKLAEPLWTPPPPPPKPQKIESAPAQKPAGDRKQSAGKPPRKKDRPGFRRQM